MIDYAQQTDRAQRIFGVKQPRLFDDFGCEFFGVAETVTGHAWWYVKDGRRYPLRSIAIVVAP